MNIPKQKRLIFNMLKIITHRIMSGYGQGRTIPDRMAPWKWSVTVARTFG